MQEAKLWAKSNKNFALYFNQENLVKDLIRDRIAELAKKISDYWGFACEVMMIDAFDKKEWDEVLVFSKEEVKRTEDPIVEQAIEILDAQIV